MGRLEGKGKVIMDEYRNQPDEIPRLSRPTVKMKLEGSLLTAHLRGVWGRGG